ncbi:MAG: hypothetical protein ACKOT0_00930 [bacterium]
MSEAWSGDRPRRLLNLLVGAVFVVLILIPYIDELPPADATPWLIAAAVVAVVLLGLAVYQFRTARTRRTGLLEAIPDVLLVLAPVPALVGWPAEIGLAFILAAFLISIRDLARGHAMAFSLIAVFGVLVITSFVLAEVEEKAGEGNMRNAWEAMFWGLGQIFRFHRSVSYYAPRSEEGNLVGIGVVLAGVFFSAVLISAITAWAVNSSRKKSDARHDDELIAKAVASAVERAVEGILGPEAAAKVAASFVVPPETGPSARAGEQRAWIDVDRAVGELPFGWWTSRRVAVPDYLRDLRQAADLPWGLDGEGLPFLVAVVEGSGSAEPEGETSTASGARLVVIHAEPAGTRGGGAATSSLILERAAAGDVVVTDRPELVATLRERGIAVVSPRSASAATA